MKRFVKYVTRHWPVLAVCGVLVIIFYKTFFFGLVPFPSDLLVSWFFPYKNGGWEGFNEWTTHKEFIAADVVRQLYPWRTLAMDLFNSGTIPLWNPYSFSGTPLLANVQSAVFYPLNILFVVLDSKLAWVTYILLQPVLAIWFMYLFIRSIGLSKYAGVFSGVAFACIGYTTIWFELGVVGHSALWLPFILWGINQYITHKKIHYLLACSLGIAVSILAGHAQTAVYTLLVSGGYYLFASLKKGTVWSVLKNSWFFVLGITLASLQIIPSLELMSWSARDVQTSSEVFHRFQLPVYHLITLIAPDFFGNPSVGNFWGSDYGEFMAYSGVVAVLFAGAGIFYSRYRREVLFFVGSIIIALLFALPTPFPNLLETLQIPVLGTGIPSRALFVAEFAVVVLAGIGVERFIVQKKFPLKVLLFFAALFFMLWVWVLSAPHIFSDIISAEKSAIALRNMILPTSVFISCIVTVSVVKFRPRYTTIAFFVLLFVASCEYSYFMNKFLPFARMDYIYPDHPLVQHVQKITPPERVYGYDSSRAETNLSVAWKVLSPEGYDPLYIRRYGELIHATTTGGYTSTIPRSDAMLPQSMPNDDSHQKRVLMDLLGIRYALDKDDSAPVEWKQDPGRFDPERYKLIWQEYKWKIYENQNVLPRAVMYYNSETIDDEKQIIKRLFSQDFSIKKTVLLEDKEAKVFTSEKNAIKVPIRSYTANSVTVTPQSDQAGYVFLSDAYYPGWNVYVDGTQSTLLRANYAFRAVEVPAGRHVVEFRYEPWSFRIGALISGISLMIIIGFMIRSFRK